MAIAATCGRNRKCQIPENDLQKRPVYLESGHLVYAIEWCRHQESNPGPTDYKSVALPAELCRLLGLRAGRRVAQEYPVLTVFVDDRTRTLARLGTANSLGFILGPVASNGLIWEDLSPGQGRRVLPGDSVVCYYSGSFETASGGGPFGVGSKTTTTVFDQTKEGEPFKFVVGKGQVIKGWDLGILGGLDGEILPMSVGGVRRLYIPSGLAYGPNSVGPIPANQDLTFDLEVLYAQKESDISTEKRLGGYAAALAIPAVLLFIAFNVFPLLF